jgi:hypothetical protein
MTKLDLKIEEVAREGLGWSDPVFDTLVEKLKTGDGSDFMLMKWNIAYDTAKIAYKEFHGTGEE